MAAAMTHMMSPVVLDATPFFFLLARPPIDEADDDDDGDYLQQSKANRTETEVAAAEAAVARCRPNGQMRADPYGGETTPQNSDFAMMSTMRSRCQCPFPNLSRFAAAIEVKEHNERWKPKPRLTPAILHM